MPVIKSWKQNEMKVMSADHVKQNCRAKHLTAQPGSDPTALTTDPRISAGLFCPDWTFAFLLHLPSCLMFYCPPRSSPIKVELPQ